MMADKLLDYSDYEFTRFSCSCLSSDHLLGVTVEYWDDGAIIMFESGLAVKSGIWNRIKAAIACLRNGSFCPQSDFHLRPEDVGPLIAQLGRALPGARNTAST